MPSNTQQPTILVKKSDGTSVRMTMDDFKAYKAGLGQPTVVKVSAKGGSAFGGEDKTEIKIEPKKLEQNVPVLPNVNPGKLVLGGPNVQKHAPRMMEVKYVDETIEDKVKVEATTAAAVSRPYGGKIENVSAAPQFKSQSQAQSLVPVKEEKKMVQSYVKDDFADAMTAPTSAEMKLPGALNVSSDVAQKAEEILKKITIPLAQDLRGRLLSLLQSRLKDVRTDDQVLEYLRKAQKDGGIGLSEDDARYVLGLVQDVLPTSKVKVSAQGGSALGGQVEDKVTSLVQKPVVLAPATVTNAPPLRPIPMPVKPISAVAPQPKVVLHDVLPPKPVAPVVQLPKASTGPLEELGAFSLNDLHRLGKTGAEATARLLSKFEAWKGESYVFYLDARAAWHKSPLFVAYQTVMVDALKQGKRAQEILSGGNGITLDEFEAIIKLNAKLN